MLNSNFASPLIIFEVIFAVMLFLKINVSVSCNLLEFLKKAKKVLNVSFLCKLRKMVASCFFALSLE